MDWIKYDKKDTSTWPPTDKLIIVSRRNFVYTSVIYFKSEPEFTHWMPIPNPPKLPKPPPKPMEWIKFDINDKSTWPESSKDVVVTFAYNKFDGRSTCTTFFYEDGAKFACALPPFNKDIKVVAWMPLLEPYEG